MLAEGGFSPEGDEDTADIEATHRNSASPASISVVHDLIGAGLVDEYRLFVYPVVLGQGARLFADATDEPELRLLEAKPYRSGIVLMRYSTA